MNKYFKYAEMGFLENLYYRTHNILVFLSSFLIDYIKVAVWYGVTAVAIHRISADMINEIIMYMIASSAISAIYRVTPNNTLSDAYMKGTLLNRLMYPANILICNFFDVIGKTVGRLLINSVPTFIILQIVFRPHWHIVLNRLPIVIINILFAILSNYLLFCIVDSLCFWLKQPASIQKLKDIFVKLFSGALLPLWMLPDYFEDVINIFPFSKYIYVPVNYLLGTEITDVYIRHMNNLVIWNVVCIFLLSIIWKKGVKRAEIYGG